MASVFSLLAVALAATPALAAPIVVTRTVPPSGIVGANLGGSTIFLNRCVGGCLVHPGDHDDSSVDTTRIVQSESNLPEYTMFAPGEWEATVQCVKEVYSPYDVNIVDTRPASGDYAMIDVGGQGADIGETMAGVGGVALLTGDCSVSSTRGMAFAFTDQLNVFAQEDGGSRVHGLCWIIAQETAHIYGLDHEYRFTDDKASACSDPMTYRDDCGGQKFFRNFTASCGEFAVRAACGPPPSPHCGATQNSHAKLTTIFGPGTPIFAPPNASIMAPAAMTPVFATTEVLAMASAPRNVTRVELWINGFRWGGAQKGANIGAMGQPAITYTLPIPANLPDSILDLTVKAFDDLEEEGDSPVVTVYKGAPAGCADASTCATGQKCETGRCFWDPPAGEVGDACTFDQFCKTGLCTGTSTQTICTHPCGLTDPNGCETGLTCAPTSDTVGVCFPDAGGGCCSTGRDSAAGTAMRLALALGALGLVLRRRAR